MRRHRLPGGMRRFARPFGSISRVTRRGLRIWRSRCWRAGFRCATSKMLSEYEITYLFVDGIAERLRPGAKREPVLAAGGFTIEGRRALVAASRHSGLRQIRTFLH